MYQLLTAQELGASVKVERISLSDRILRYIRNSQQPVSGKIIEDLASRAGFKASNASRRCRELANDGEIRAVIIKGSVWYEMENNLIIKQT